MTITGKLVVEIGDREPTPGYLYVALSRPTRIENLCIGKAKPCD